jgi:hypothetical protein
MDQTRSAVWPLMAALVIGLSIGFAGGYGVGTTREHTTVAGAETQASQPAATVAPSPALPAPTLAVGRDATEVAVAPKVATPPKKVAPPAKAPPRAAVPSTPDRRAASTPDRGTPARTTPERQPSRPPERAPAPVPAGTSGAYVGRLSVDSRPSGARVFLDNQQIGVTPLALPGVRAGEHAVRIERDGYRRWSSTVRVVAGEQNRVTASLDR